MDYVEKLRARLGHERIILNGSVAVLRDGAGRLLLQHRADGRWGLPGGLMELGESFADTAVREVREETGLTLAALTPLGVWSGPGLLCRVSNGDEFYCVTAAFLSESWRGELKKTDEEALGYAWCEPGALPEPLVASHRRVLRDSGLIPHETKERDDAVYFMECERPAGLCEKGL